MKEERVTQGEQTFGFYIPNISLMGVGCSKEAGAQAKALGMTRALIVSDAGLVKLGHVDKIKKVVEASGVKTAIYSEVISNPTDSNVHRGVEFYKAEKCDGIISVGGGSPHDCAKGIGIVVSNGGNIRDYEGVNKTTKPLPPLMAINTTAGTASEMTRFCIITNTDTRVKMALVDYQCTPRVAIDDPELMLTMPPELTAATGMDALTHAIEAYLSTIATPITDVCALKAIELISKWLRPAVANGDNIEPRDKMAYAQYLAGMAFNNASLGYVHAMAHQLGGLYNLPHGVCNAILLPAVCDYNLIACPQRFADIAMALGENIEGLSPIAAAERANAAIRRLSRDIGIPKGLEELGVKEKDLETMARNAQKDACQATNPRHADLQQVVGIFKSAMAA